MDRALTETTIIIIGAGFAGICMAIQLKKAGIDDFVILEVAPKVGGVWRDNTYPGCACDVPSHLYSFSFERNPEWSRKYSPQPEILEYIEHCTDAYGLGPYLRFGVEITQAVYDETNARWQLLTADGRRFRCRFLIAGIGALRVPAIPTIKGAQDFTGAAFHSSRWDHNFDLRGKRVAVVGTGASSIQLVPAIADKVEKLYLFQRTAPWILPRPDRRFHSAERSLFRRIPGVERIYRELIYWRQESAAIAFIRFPGILRLAERLARKHIRQTIADPDLRRKVTPSYAIGCKRILLSNNYYPALTRDNVEVLTQGLAEFRSESVITDDGREIGIDAVIYGTGFALKDLLAPMKVIGKGGQDLAERWRATPEAYLGVTVSDFPNFFILTGPNTGLGHSSMIFMIECHVHYVLRCIRHVLKHDLKAIEVRPEAMQRFNQRLREKLKHTVWSTGCKSWYLDDKGHNFTLWPGHTWSFWLQTRRLRRRDYSFR
ncbi:MAG TPA: NAD(P)/FAD-dependent oxidoreductase [Nannocystis exedens]|nr:NAD(P)/FAD-dependent oxidoreductase [Nannocystis exedens]